MSKSASSLFRHLAHRWDRYGLRLRRVLSWRHPDLFMRLRWPLGRPWQAQSLMLRAPGGGIGDEIMASIIIAEIKRKNASCKITLVSRYPALWQNVPEIDEVLPFDKENPQGISLGFGHMLPPPRSLPAIIGEQIGLKVEQIRLLPPRPSVSPELKATIAAIPRPRILIQPEASGFTPNKEWPRGYWEKLTRELVKSGSVLEAGKAPFFKEDLGPAFHSFAGKTDVAGFAYLVSQADLVICPVSGGMHLAEAYGVKSVTIFGGYELPSGHPYPGMTAFYEPVSCAPCWLDTECPHQRKCLQQITPEAVLAAALKALKTE